MNLCLVQAIYNDYCNVADLVIVLIDLKVEVDIKGEVNIYDHQLNRLFKTLI